MAAAFRHSRRMAAGAEERRTHSPAAGLQQISALQDSLLPPAGIGGCG